MEIKEISDKNIWEDFLLGCQERTFLQSWNWGEFNKLMGNKIWRLGVFDKGNLVSIVLAVKIQAKRGTFLQIQHWPSLAKQGEANSQRSFSLFGILLNKLKEIAREEGCSFIRVAPLLERNKENIKLFKDLGFREAPMHANAYEATLKLDLSPTEKELLMNMRKTTRYLIRQAEKNPDLKIVKSDKIDDIEVYNKLSQEVAKHQRFTPFSSDFIKKEFEVFSKDNQALLFFGQYKGEAVAGALIIFWSGVGFYHQAALLPRYHKIPVAYLLLWEAIKEAKKRGCLFFDFWGYVNPKENLHPPKFSLRKLWRARHPWAGPTLFKMGFGGRIYHYLKTQDLPLSKRYWLTYLFEKLRKIKRGL